jgi:hypothetical protein
MKNLITLAICICIGQIVYAQTTFTSVTGDVSWRNNATWTGTATFPTHDPISNNNYTIPVNSTVRLGSTSDPRDLTATNTSENRAFTINGILIVYGDLDFGNKAADIVIGNGAFLIVFGNIVVDNKMDISTTGSIVATGSFTKTGAENQGSYTGGGNVYASPISVPGTWVPVADQKNNTTDLANDYPNIYNFINCGGGPSCSLPIKLSYFQGSTEETGSTVKLRWATSREENFARFDVQRSNNGIDYHSLGTLSASGKNNVDIETFYSFDDINPFRGANYYRLKAIDLDGKFELFEPIRVFNDNAVNSVSVYPNPSENGRIQLALNFVPGESDKVTLVSQLGAEVMSFSVQGFNEWLQLREPLHPGIYYLRYNSASFTSTTRLVVK